MKPCRLNDIHYQKMLEQSGLNPIVLNFYYDYFIENIGRRPTLRELPNADSSKYLIDKLNVKDNTVKIQRVLDFTNTNNLEEATIKLNNEFNDQVIEIIPIQDFANIKFTPKASKFTENNFDKSNISGIPFLNIIDGEVNINETSYLKEIQTGVLLHNPNKVYENMCKELSNNFNINEIKPVFIKNIKTEQLIKNNKPYLRISNNSDYIDIIKKDDFGFYEIQSNIQKPNKYLINTLKSYIPAGACCISDIPIGIKVGETINNKSVYQKPSTLNIEILPKEDLQKIQNSFREIDNIQILNTLDNLQKILGIKTNTITTNEILNNSTLSNIPNISSAAAFVFNNEIYVNTDKASGDSATHELLHILLGHFKTIAPESYYNMISKASNFKTFQQIASNYKNRTQQDIYEEVFVNEIAQWLNGYNSSIDLLTAQEQYELQFNICNVLDTIIKGKESAESFQQLNVLNYSLNELAAMLNSSTEDILVSSASQRSLANLKEDLFKNNLLKEIC